jgi:hypothetical protein
LWISADQPSDGNAKVLLEDVVDLTVFGDSDRRNHMTEMMIAVPATPGLAPEVRRRTARLALVEMARQFGFLGAEESSF